MLQPSSNARQAGCSAAETGLSPRRGRGHAAVVASQAAQAATTSLPLTCGPCSGASRLSGNRRRRAPLVSRQPRSGALARSALWPLRLRLCRSRNEAEPAASGAADQAATSVARGQPRPVPRSVAQTPPAPSREGNRARPARGADEHRCDPRSHLGSPARSRASAPATAPDQRRGHELPVDVRDSRSCPLEQAPAAGRRSGGQRRCSSAGHCAARGRAPGASAPGSRASPPPGGHLSRVPAATT